MSTQIGKMPSGQPQVFHLRGRDTGTDSVALINAYSARLFDYCQVLLGNPDAAAAAFQAARDEATARIDQLPGGDQARGWLYAMARRHCQQRRSSQVVAASPAGQTEAALAPAGQALRVLAAETTGHSAGGQPPGPAAVSDDQTADAYTAEFGLSDLAAAERSQEIARLQCVLEGLPERDREILNLAFRHDMAATDLAAILKVSRHQAGRVLSAAVTDFEQRSIAVILTRQGWVGCLALDKVAGDVEDEAPLTRRLCRRVAWHSRKCVVCGQIVANWAFGPESLSQLPLATPPAGIERLELPKRRRQPAIPAPAAAGSDLAVTQVAGAPRVAETRPAEATAAAATAAAATAPATTAPDATAAAATAAAAAPAPAATHAPATDMAPATRADEWDVALGVVGFPGRTTVRTDEFARAKKVSEPGSADRQGMTVAAGVQPEEMPALSRPARSGRWVATAAAGALLVVVAGGLLIGGLLLKPARHSQHPPKAVPAATASTSLGTSTATSRSGRPSRGAGSASARATPPGDIYAPLPSTPVYPVPQPGPTSAPARRKPTPTPRPKGSHSPSPSPTPSSSATSASPTPTPSGSTTTP